MDRVSVLGLEVETIIGVHDWEKTTRQQVVIDLELFCDTREAAATDNLEDTLSYGDIARLVTGFVSQSQFNLIETLAEQVASQVLAAFAVERLVLTVGKPGAVKNARTVAVTIERSQP